MSPLRRVCVFCGSSDGADPAHAEAADRLGRHLARERITVVYGGGNVGLMGVLADAALADGGEVIGVIPHGLVERELAHDGLTQLHRVESMHERKRLMADLSDGFVALPGGLGTLEELFEIWTWAVLGIHVRPIGLLDVNDYFPRLLGFLDHAVDSGFVRPEHRAILKVAGDPAELLEALRSYEPPAGRRWLSRTDT